MALLCNVVHSEEEEISYNKPFYDACANGNMQKVQNYLKDDPSKCETKNQQTRRHFNFLRFNL